MHGDSVTSVMEQGGMPPQGCAKAGKYLTFRLAAETYGIEILKVQEIIAMMSVTRMPRSAEYVRGVINLRGKILPVIDLRLKFQMQAEEDTNRTCIIVVQVRRRRDHVTVGLIVDEVSEVLGIAEEQLEPAPAFGASVATDFVLGMAKVASKVVILMDMDKVLADDDTVFSVVDQGELESSEASV